MWAGVDGTCRRQLRPDRTVRVEEINWYDHSGKFLGITWESEEHVLQQGWAPVLLGVHPRGILPLCPWRQGQGCSYELCDSRGQEAPQTCTKRGTDGHVVVRTMAMSTRWHSVLQGEEGTIALPGHCIASGLRPLFCCDHSCPHPLASICVISPLPPHPPFYRTFFLQQS